MSPAKKVPKRASLGKKAVPSPKPSKSPKKRTKLPTPARAKASRENGKKGGREPLYKTPEEMAEKTEEYFRFIANRVVHKVDKESGRQIDIIIPAPARITGWLIYLGFSGRDALDRYEKLLGFSDIIKRARLRIEDGIAGVLVEA